MSGLKCYKSVASLPEPPELALIAVPSARVKEALNNCIEAGVKACIIVTANIQYETTDHSEERASLIARARQRGMRICGPNCEGAIYLSTGTWATFLTHPSPVRGDIALVTQSGGIGEFLLYRMWERKIGVSGWVSSGNEIDLQAADYIEYFAEDDETKAISVFLEDARDGPKFIRAARVAFEKQKPLVILKVGRSERGSMAVLSHTGAIAGKYGVYTGLFRQLGIVRAKNLQGLVDLPLALTRAPLPAGNRVGVVADSGGMGALFADLLDQEGLSVTALEPETRAKLAELLPAKEQAANPLDFTALVGAKEVVNVLDSIDDIMLRDKTCDMLILGVGNWTRDVLFNMLEVFHKAVRDHGKPVLPLFTAIPPTAHDDLLARAAELRLPICFTPEAAVTSASALFEYGQARREGLDN